MKSKGPRIKPWGTPCFIAVFVSFVIIKDFTIPAADINTLFMFARYFYSLYNPVIFFVILCMLLYSIGKLASKIF
jgi:hypothetical protein